MNKLMIGTLLALVLAGCAASTPIIEGQLVVDDPYDFAAVGFVDCGQLSIVAIIRSDGKIVTQKVEGAAMLIDTQLRLAQVAYDRVVIIPNPRVCGILDLD